MTQNLPTKVLWVRPPPRVPVEIRRDQLQSEAVSGEAARAGETQTTGRSRGMRRGGGGGSGVKGEVIRTFLGLTQNLPTM